MTLLHNVLYCACHLAVAFVPAVAQVQVDNIANGKVDEATIANYKGSSRPVVGEISL